MAGSIRHVFRTEGFSMDLIENLGDAHEALEECYDVLQALYKIAPGLVVHACQKIKVNLPDEWQQPPELTEGRMFSILAIPRNSKEWSVISDSFIIPNDNQSDRRPVEESVGDGVLDHLCQRYDYPVVCLIIQGNKT